MVGRRDQANRATVPPAHIAMLTRLDAKTRPARSETMVVVRSRAISAIHLGRNRLTSKAPYKGLFRTFSNRKQVAAYAGLAPTPWQSGSVHRDQGVSKAGNP